MHNILGHCEQAHALHTRGKIAYPDGKTLDYDATEMNIAQDYVINAILTESNIGEFPKQADGSNFGMLDATIATSKDSSMDIYRKLHKKRPAHEGSRRWRRQQAQWRPRSRLRQAVTSRGTRRERPAECQPTGVTKPSGPLKWLAPLRGEVDG